MSDESVICAEKTEKMFQVEEAHQSYWEKSVTSWSPNFSFEASAVHTASIISVKNAESNYSKMGKMK